MSSINVKAILNTHIETIKPGIGKLTDIIIDNLTPDQLQIFSKFNALSVSCTGIEYPIDIADVWKWMGFSRREHAEAFVKKTIKVNVDYIFKLVAPILATEGVTEVNRMFLSVRGFKVLCLTMDTECGEEVQEYYVKLEEASIKHAIKQ